MVDQEYLKECVDYFHDTGEMVWRCRPASHFNDEANMKRVNSRRAMEVCGTECHGYIRVFLDGKQYPAHRLAWLYIYGDLPSYQIDHINGVRTDNRIVNLRDVSPSENMKNISISSRNKSGHTGVSWHSRAKKWEACIRFDEKKIYLGVFSKKEDAINARLIANKKYGYHENHGKP